MTSLLLLAGRTVVLKPHKKIIISSQSRLTFGDRISLYLRILNKTCLIVQMCIVSLNDDNMCLN